eukprot:1042355-Pyramimonas_sp.AAC.1
MIDDAEQLWDEWCNEPGNQITRQSCPKVGENTFDKQQWAFIQKEFPGKWDYWDTYERMKAFRNGLQSLEVLDVFKDTLGKYCDFTQMVNFKLHDLVWLFHTVYSNIKTRYIDSLPSEKIGMAVICAIELCLPLEEREEGNHTPPCLLRVSSETQAKLLAKITLLLTPMTEGAIYKKAGNDGPPATEAPQQPAESENKGDSRKRGGKASTGG